MEGKEEYTEEECLEGARQCNKLKKGQEAGARAKIRTRVIKADKAGKEDDKEEEEYVELKGDGRTDLAHGFDTQCAKTSTVPGMCSNVWCLKGPA